MAPFVKRRVMPPIPVEEQTPRERVRVDIIEQQQTLIDSQKATLEQRQLQIDQLSLANERQLETIQEQQPPIEALKAEVAGLKKLPKRPKIRPSPLPKDDDESDHDDSDDTGASGQGETDDAKGKTPKSRKRKKKLIIHKTQIIKPANLPEGSRPAGL